MNRRDFLSWVSVGMLASSLPIVLAACKAETDDVTNSPATGDVTKTISEDGYQAITTVEDVKAQGVVLDENSTATPILVFENPATGEVAAVNPTCTHRGCLVEWQSEDQLFVCPCHDAKFATNGDVIEGVATEPLNVYETKVEDNSVLVKVS